MHKELPVTKAESKISVWRRYQSVAAFAVFVLIGLGLLLFGIYSKQSQTVVVDNTPVATSSAVVGKTLAKSLPMHISIPTAKIEADFGVPLGLKPDGEIEVPTGYEKVGYYQYGPTPGELGPAVVLGHVDSFEGPAVFYSLGQLKVGDPIIVKREDGSVATFAVTEMERRPQSDFPTAKVYSDVPYAGLRLITCTGIYDHGQLRYSHNLIVYAKLVENTSSEETIN